MMFKLMNALLLATVAVGAAVPPPGPNFTFKNFELRNLGSLEPGKSRIAFDLSTSDGATTDLHCEHVEFEEGTGRIIPFGNVQCDQYFYSLIGSADEGFSFQIMDARVAGDRDLVPDDFIVVTEPTVSFEVYQGPTEFTIETTVMPK